MPAISAAGRRPLWIALAACLLPLIAVHQALGQFAVGGVYVDPAGMLRQTNQLSADERLELLRAEAFAPPGSAELAAASSLRKVSLRRLEQTVRKLHAADRPLPADVRYLAGLNRITHVFFYPEAGDVVVAGPAEGWKQTATGAVVGTRSQRPPLELDDLIVALRYAFDERPAAGFIGCSIEPTADGLRKYAAYMRRLSGIDRTRVAEIFAGMERTMGPQTVKLFGVEGSSRFALKLLAADYRLKRIALAHDPSPVKEVVNYLDLAAKRLRPGPQLQHRWWFVGGYDAIYHTPDQLAFELEGQGVRVATARSRPADGDDDDPKKDAQETKASPAARQFAAAMTEHFEDVAAHRPVFAQLQNLIGLSVAAELCAARHQADRRSWKPAAFLDPAACPIRSASVPRSVPSLANFRLVKNRHWLISISGGVEINPREMTGRAARQQSPPERQLSRKREAGTPPETGRWWWD